MSVLINLAERWFTVLSLFFFTDPVALFQIVGSEKSQVERTQKVLMLAITVITVVLIALWRGKIIPIALKEKGIWILVGICCLSVLWSDNPPSTVRHCLLLIQTTLFGLYFSTRYKFSKQLQLLAWAFSIGAVLSLVFAVALPSYGVMGLGNITSSEDLVHIGTWRGVYTHKNPLGRIMCLGAITLLLVAMSKRKYSWLAWASFGFSAVLLQQSKSKTALAILLTIIALLPFYRALRWNYTLAIPFFITLIFGAGMAIIGFLGNAETILGSFGGDLTLTGRTGLWSAVLDKVWEQPWFGYGYVGFWVGAEGQSADIWGAVGWEPPHAHNGFLDIWVNLGLLGLVVFLLSFFILFLRAIAWARQTQTSEGLFPLCYLTFMVFANLTESSLVEDNIFWVLYLSIAMLMHNSTLNLEDQYDFEQQHLHSPASNK